MLEEETVDILEQSLPALSQSILNLTDATNDALVEEGKAFMEMAYSREKKTLETINAHSKVFASLLITSLVLGCVRCRVALKKFNRKPDSNKWYRRTGTIPANLVKYPNTIPNTSSRDDARVYKTTGAQLTDLSLNHYIVGDGDQECYYTPGFTSRVPWTPSLFACITVSLLVAFQVGFYWMNDVRKRPDGFLKSLPAWRLDDPVTQLPSVITEACEDVPPPFGGDASLDEMLDEREEDDD